MLLVSSLLLLRGLASADTASIPELPTWTFEAGARIGSLFGNQRDRDELFYGDAGLTTVDKNGKSSPLSLSVTAGGLELGAYKKISPKATIGLALSFLEASSEPDVQIKDAARSFVSQKSIALRLRYCPFLRNLSGNRAFIWSIEPGIGYTNGNIRRFALARSQLDGVLDTLPSNVQAYILDAAKRVDASGPRFEFSTTAGFKLSNGMQYGAGLGLDYTLLNIASDPLARWTTPRGPYPSKLDQVGFFFRTFIAFGR